MLLRAHCEQPHDAVGSPLGTLAFSGSAGIMNLEVPVCFEGDCGTVNSCLSQQEMAAFLEGSASVEELAAWRRHLRVCDVCARAVAGLRAGVATPPESDADTLVWTDTGKTDTVVVGLEPNLQIGDFRLERRLGCGGMGVVYQAMQLSLHRRVALKVLPLGLAAGPSAVERFHREARAAAKLHHPNIVTIFAEGAERNVCYFAMEMIDGENLDHIIADLRRARAQRRGGTVSEPGAAPGAEPDNQAEGATNLPCVLRDCTCSHEYFRAIARLIAEVAEALSYAHSQGVIHRDVKPSNLMLSGNGRLILLDFGIARICEERGTTLTGAFVGTPRYMSPEQIAGGQEKPDHRSDVYSLGVTLYELLTLESPFEGDTQHQVIGQILSKEPRRPRQIDRHIPTDLETICGKAMAKEASRRYRTAGELADDLRRYLDGHVIRAKRPGVTRGLIKFVRRHPATVALGTAAAILGVLAASIAWTHYSTRWAQQYAMAEIDRLIGQNEFYAASLLAEKAQRYIPDDPLLHSRWPQMSRECTITTDPPGARVYLSPYGDRRPAWKYLGLSPVRQARIPYGTFRWRLERAGFLPVEVVRSNKVPSPSADPADSSAGRIDFALNREGSMPADMVWIPPATLDQSSLFHGERTIPNAPAFLIDKYEVTNRQYKEFLDSGGYENEAFWQEPFVKDGRRVAWSQAREEFRDETGVFGPSTWRNGTYRRWQANYPVGGISWYEAAAYARFREKALPTIFHWTFAARADDEPYRITALSNFSDGPARVGACTGMGRFGLYDAAGNVREWCYNALAGTADVRCLLGGAWGEYDTAFINGAAHSPWNRDRTNGVRCVKYLEGRETVPLLAFEPVKCQFRDFTKFKPASDEVFSSYIDTYRYDLTALNARVEGTDEDLGYCRRERITFDATYANERVTAYLHLPYGVKEPYQAVVWYPSGIARFSPWDQRAYTHELVCIIRSGRAVIVPIYKGTYERDPERPLFPPDRIQSRNLYIQRSQDMRRAIDYLQTRKDIDIGKLAFAGLAWGGQMGPVMIAVEERFKTGILLLGGICACKRHPASDPANFAPHVTIPILMVNGRDDSLFPVETAQKPLFDLLGTPAEHKKHVLFPGEHSIPPEYRKQYHKEIVDWLDKYLGPIQRIDD
jgi:serine/threonine protein kinase/formylglycine-generating enzyme required for sulfatase activity/dienelactone hydrolase